MNDPTLHIASLVLAMARASAVLAALPFASRTWAGTYVIMPMALAVALLVPAPLTELPSGPRMLLLVAKEAAVGLAVGLVIARVFHIVAASGALLDQQAGYTFGATLNPTVNMTTGPIETLFSTTLTLMLFSNAGAFTLAKTIALTFQGWPALSLLPLEGGGAELFDPQLLGATVQLMHELALRLAAPAMALLLMADISLMVASRYAQQLNPFSISLALKALAMTLLLAWMLPRSLPQWRALLDTAVPVP